MGHYDDCYEATRLSDEALRRERLRTSISDNVEKMTNYQLETIHEVVENVEEYAALISILQRNGNRRLF